MIPTSTLETRLAERRCAVEATLLQPCEDVLSRGVAPFLYGDSVSPDGEGVVNSVLDATIDLMLSGAGRLRDEDRSAVGRFWARFLSRSSVTRSSREDVVQHYLYHFWDNAIGDDLAFNNLQDAFIPQIESTWIHSPNISSKLADRFRKHAPVDIVARLGTSLLLVEVKYGEADDRAIGQILRYFEAARYIVSKVDHRCDIRSIVPVLVVSDFPIQHWPAFPPPFRELLRIRYYRPNPDGQMQLDDARPKIMNLLKGQQRIPY